eukprot:9258602-Pyramimonas_sp.AAC.1
MDGVLVCGATFSMRIKSCILKLPRRVFSSCEVGRRGVPQIWLDARRVQRLGQVASLTRDPGFGDIGRCYVGA